MSIWYTLDIFMQPSSQKKSETKEVAKPNTQGSTELDALRQQIVKKYGIDPDNRSDTGKGIAHSIKSLWSTLSGKEKMLKKYDELKEVEKERTKIFVKQGTVGMTEVKQEHTKVEEKLNGSKDKKEKTVSELEQSILGPELYKHEIGLQATNGKKHEEEADALHKAVETHNAAAAATTVESSTVKKPRVTHKLKEEWSELKHDMAELRERQKQLEQEELESIEQGLEFDEEANEKKVKALSTKSKQKEKEPVKIEAEKKDPSKTKAGLDMDNELRMEFLLLARGKTSSDPSLVNELNDKTKDAFFPESASLWEDALKAAHDALKAHGKDVGDAEAMATHYVMAVARVKAAEMAKIKGKELEGLRDALKHEPIGKYLHTHKTSRLRTLSDKITAAVSKKKESAPVDESNTLAPIRFKAKAADIKIKTGEKFDFLPYATGEKPMELAAIDALDDAMSSTWLPIHTRFCRSIKEAGDEKLADDYLNAIAQRAMVDRLGLDRADKKASAALNERIESLRKAGNKIVHHT